MSPSDDRNVQVGQRRNRNLRLIGFVGGDEGNLLAIWRPCGHVLITYFARTRGETPCSRTVSSIDDPQSRCVDLRITALTADGVAVDHRIAVRRKRDLYQAGAEGGTVRFIQPQPSLTDYSGYARAGVSTTANGAPSYETGVAFGGPIIQDELGFRISVWHRRDGGYIDHDSAIPGGAQYDNSNWSDSDVIRMALTAAPTDSLKITPSMYYQHIYYNDVPTFDPAGSPVPGDVFTQNWASLNPTYSNVGDGRLVFQGLQLQPSSDQLYLPALKIQQHFDAVDFTSSTSYLYRRYAAQQDFTTLVPVIIGLPWPTTANAAATSFTPSNQNVFTQELRAQSAESDRRLQWTFGLFYTKSRQESSQLVWSPYLTTQLAGTNLLPGNIP
jgi:iron complex outermembrane recepter protein